MEVDASIQSQFHQQVGDGVQGAFEIIANASELPGFFARQCNGPGLAGHQHPGDPAKQQTQEHADESHLHMRDVVETPLEARQCCNVDLPLVPAHVQGIPASELGDGFVTALVPAAKEQRFGRLNVAFENGQADIGSQFNVESGDQVRNPERCVDPGQQGFAALLLGVEPCTIGIDQQIHHDGGRRIRFAGILDQPELARQCHIAAVA